MKPPGLLPPFFAYCKRSKTGGSIGVEGLETRLHHTVLLIIWSWIAAEK